MVSLVLASLSQVRPGGEICTIVDESAAVVPSCIEPHDVAIALKGLVEGVRACGVYKLKSIGWVPSSQ